jgi:hypothetical protein
MITGWEEDSTRGGYNFMPKICPECHAEYQQRMVLCSDCKVALIVVEDQNGGRGQYKYVGDEYRRESYNELRGYPKRFAKAFAKWFPLIAIWLFLQYLSLKWTGINLPQVILSLVGGLLFLWKVLTEARAGRRNPG